MHLRMQPMWKWRQKRKGHRLDGCCDVLMVGRVVSEQQAATETKPHSVMRLRTNRNRTRTSRQAQGKR